MNNKEQIFCVIILSILIIPILSIINSQNLDPFISNLEPSPTTKTEEIVNNTRYYYTNATNPYIMYFDFNEYQIEDGSTLVFNWTMTRGRFTIKQNGWNGTIIVMSETNGSFTFIPTSHNKLILDCMMFNWFVGITIISPLEQ